MRGPEGFLPRAPDREPMMLQMARRPLVMCGLCALTAMAVGLALLSLTGIA